MPRSNSGVENTQSPRSAAPGSTRDRATPITANGSSVTNPAMGPATPTSNNARRV